MCQVSMDGYQIVATELISKEAHETDTIMQRELRIMFCILLHHARKCFVLLTRTVSIETLWMGSLCHHVRSLVESIKEKNIAP